MAVRATQEPPLGFLLRPDIEGLRCPTGNFGEDPACSGTACLPCYYAHITKLHPEKEVLAQIKHAIRLWNATLTPHIGGALDPIVPESKLWGQEGALLTGYIRGFITKMSSILLNITKANLVLLAACGGVRAQAHEVLQIAQTQGFLS